MEPGGGRNGKGCHRYSKKEVTKKEMQPNKENAEVSKKGRKAGKQEVAARKQDIPARLLPATRCS